MEIIIRDVEEVDGRYKVKYKDGAGGFFYVDKQTAEAVSIPIEPPVKPAKNVKDFDWLDNKLSDILAQFEHKHITKEGAKDLLYEFIFEELVSQIQKLKDSSLSV